MDFPESVAVASGVRWVPSSPSTNAELRRIHEEQPQPHGFVLITDTQPAGRGRLGRTWELPPGQAIAFSVLLEGFSLPGAPGVDADESAPLGLGWIPLLVGSAVARAMRPLLAPTEVAVKWPNDVLVAGKKLCGILCELLPDGTVIAGIGVNLFIPAEELPTDRATSVLIAGGFTADQLPEETCTVRSPEGAAITDRVLAQVLRELFRLHELGKRDPGALRRAILADSGTVASRVSVHLAAGERVPGMATGLSADGSLRVLRDGGDEFAVSAGDVEHLR